MTRTGDWQDPEPWEIEAEQRRALRQKWNDYYRRRRSGHFGSTGALHELFCTAHHFGIRWYGVRCCRAIPVYQERVA